jgi:pimeloyl-ACP methyl ester carboxylesterase
MRQDNIDSIAEAMGRLIAHYKPKHTTVIARSGGAGITATIMGKRPNVRIDSAILLSGNYNQDQWLDTTSGNKRQWLDPVHGKNNRSADEFIEGIRPDAALYLVAGAQDNNVKPIIAQTYLGKLKTAGKKAILLETNNGHFGFEEDKSFRKLVDQVVSGKGPLEGKL